MHRDRHPARASPRGAQGVREAEARRLAHLRRDDGAPEGQDRQARDARRARDPRRAAQDSGRQALEEGVEGRRARQGAGQGRMIAGRRSFVLGGLAVGGCIFDRAYYEKNAEQKAFLDGLQALAKPALASNNPLQIEEAAKRSMALAAKVAVFTDWRGILKVVDGNAQDVAVTLEIGPQ